MDFLLSLWPYVVTAIAAITVALAAYEKFKVQGWKAALKSIVAGVHAGKKKLDDQGIDYKANLTILINEQVTDPRAKKLLDSVIEIVEREASASASTGDDDAAPPE